MGVKKSRKVIGSKVGTGSAKSPFTRDFKSRFRPNRSSSGKSETTSGFTAMRRTKPSGAWNLRRRCVRRVKIRLAAASSGACGRVWASFRAWFAVDDSSDCAAQPGGPTSASELRR
ncbi:hypothetical protein Adt_23823 [Abeliophyllum distichum]|uniref:Uncharacterized protein n=1 Tax=Abeliophyllum distichum TaxID=126358 RepID=A0ABD1SBY5_9LAMI